MEIKDIQTFGYTKYNRVLNKSIQHFIDSLSLSEVSYSFISPSEQVIAIPFLWNEHMDIWLDGGCEKSPLTCRENLLLIPKLVKYQQLQPYFLDEGDYPYISTIQSHQDMYIYHRHNRDGSISRLSFCFTSKTAELFIYDQINQLEQCMDHIEKQFSTEYPTIFQQFEITKHLKPTRLFRSASKKEKYTFNATQMACFKAIYFGFYDAKIIGKILNKSPRTVESIISFFCNHFECANKYELVVKISKMHEKMRYFLKVDSQPFLYSTNI